MKHKLSFLAIFAIICTCVSVAYASYSYEDSYGFTMTIKQNRAWNYTSNRYRESQRPENRWKVNLQHSTEGAGTVVNFKLSSSDHKTNLSNTYAVAQGTGPHYYYAYASAGGRDVCLAGQNNNNVNKEYVAMGVWDEEVGY